MSTNDLQAAPLLRQRASGVHAVPSPGLSVHQVKTAHELDTVQRKRFEILSAIMPVADGAATASGRLVCPDDEADTTSHYLAFEDVQCVGAVTVRYVSDGCPRTGFEMEQSFELAGLVKKRCAEISRLCIDPGHGNVLVAFKAKLLELAMEHSLDGLIAEVDLRTDDAAEADRVYALAQALALTREASDRTAPRGASRRLPETLRVFQRFFGARIIGPWGVHPVFPRIVAPVFALTSKSATYPTAFPKKAS